MPGDHTRFSFDPFDDHIGVRMQQGRVMLDADFNELVEIRDRRSRAGTLDTIGRGAVPDETPHGFEILPGGASVTIGVGRMYVDGQLAENHGLAPREWEPHLAEERGTLAVPYEQQPYFPNVAVEAPFPAAGGPHLVYLDVWQRELTHLEDPELLEKALGVDTATRLQTVWQVKVLANVNADCATPDGQIPAWVAATAPSAGRLTTAAVGVPTSNDPCVVNPTGGYRGTENRLYRVEVHTPGPIGTATFKWSRDNGSVGAAVTAINAGRDRLTVSRTRRDAVLRFSANDWVEVTDDWRELAGKPGVMAKVLSVDDVAQTLTLTAALPAGVFDLAAPAGRHTRVRRWDQKGLVLDAANVVVADVNAGGGEIHVNAAPAMVLEDGVQVTFSVNPAGGSFKVGDFWVFAARTVDASVEILTQAPPRGIHHHYARLAMVTLPDDVEDCRPHWPPDFGRSCCTRVVRPGESIQAAIDSLPAAGGCVCLKVGVHQITQTLVIARSRVHFHGESLGAVVLSTVPQPLLRIGSLTGGKIAEVRVESIDFRSDADGNGAGMLVAVILASDVAISDCQVGSRRSRAGFAVRIEASQQVCLERLVTSGTDVAVGAGKRSRRVEVLDGDFVAPLLEQRDSGFCGVWFDDVTSEGNLDRSRIEGNHVRGFMRGIAVNDDPLAPIPISDALGTLIAGNEVLRTQPLAPGDPKLWGIDAAAGLCTVRDNFQVYAAGSYGGIRLAGQHGSVEGNVLGSFASDPAASEQPLAILVGTEESDSVGFGDHSRVCRNLVSERQDGIFVNGAAEVTVEGNDLGSEQAPMRFALLLARAQRAVVAGNRVQGALAGVWMFGGAQNRLSGNRVRRSLLGVAAGQETDLETVENTFELIDHEGFFGVTLLGTTRIAGCRFYGCAYNSLPASAVAVQVASIAAGVWTDVIVDGCEIRDTGIGPTGKAVPHAVTGIWLWTLGATLTGNKVHYSNPAALPDPNLEHRAVRLIGFLSAVTGEQVIAFGNALMTHNKFSGPGLSALVEVMRVNLNDNLAFRFDRTTFGHNDCEHVSTGRDDNRATVSLAALRAIVMGNHARGTTKDFFSFHLHGAPSTFLGNIHTGPVLGAAAAEPTNPNGNDFNILG